MAWLDIYTRILHRKYKPRSKCDDIRERSDNRWLNINYKKFISNNLSQEQSKLIEQLPSDWFKQITYKERITHLTGQIISDIDNITMDDAKKIQIKCKCGKINKIGARSLVRRWAKESGYKCKSCDVKTYINNSERIKKYNKTMNIVRNTKEYKLKMSNNSKSGWTDERREKASELLKERNISDKRLLESRLNMPRCSSIQETLYSILDDLKIKYYREYKDKVSDRETIINNWTFDCVIPRENNKTLLIECQGDYWHSLDKTINNDNLKASIISNNDNYELKYLWEHEFKYKDKILETIKYWMGISKLELVDFNFKDITIKKCSIEDYKLLLSKYHYLPNTGRGGIAYGAYLGDILIGVCVFSPLIRQNIKIEDYLQEETRELSRLCIHPKYQKYNFASWFVSKCIKQLDKKYKCIISYCDTTFNHDGATYRACNFKQDSVIAADYWYINKTGHIMFKKMIYNRAINNSMTESEYVTKHDYTKIYGKEKLRFIYKRDK